MLLESKDKSREWPTLKKGLHFFNVLFNSKVTEVLNAYNEFINIDIEELITKWKKWIILDIDECVAPHHWKILKKNEAKILKILEAGLKIVIFSNMKKSDRYTDLEQLWITVVTSEYAKPDIKWFHDCLNKLELEPNEVVMIWDNYLTDWWSISAWIDFIKIKPIETDYKHKSINREFQLAFRNIVDFVAINLHKTLKYK